MSSKVEDVLEKFSFELNDKKNFLIKRYTNEYVIDSEIKREIELASMKLLNVHMRVLKEILYKLSSNLNELKKSSDLKDHHQSIPLDDINFIEYQIKIISQTITYKKEYHKKFDSIIERNLISHALFSSSTPNRSTLATIRNQDGSLDFIRSGFKNLYYKNTNGIILTTYDYRIFIGLLKLWEQKGRNKKITFEFKELLKAVNRELNGGEYKAISNSIDNIVNTSIIMEEFSTPHRIKGRTPKFNPIESAQNFYPEQNLATIVLNNYLLESLLNGNYINISLMLFNDLNLTTSKILYINVLKMISENITLVAIDKLIEQLGLYSNTRHKALSIIINALRELVEFNVLKSFDIEKRGRVPLNIHFFPTEWVQNRAIRERKRLKSLFDCDWHPSVI